jgi:dephospho-CoA kinase
LPVPFVGLTGGLGAGKSTALAALAQLGAEVLSADAVVHELYETAAVRAEVRARFGAEVFDGAAVDRAALARRAFAAEEDRDWLERLIWPLVAARAQEFYRRAADRVPPPRAAVVEAPLLFEAASPTPYSATIAVIADDALRAQRIAARDQAALEQREQRQMPQAEKARRATYVVVNDGTLKQLREQLAEVLDRIAA